MAHDCDASPDPDGRTCLTCGQVRSLTEFYGVKWGDGLDRRCKACHLLRVRAVRLASRYGITTEEYEALSERQGGVCAICGDDDGDRKLAVDHDHETGRIRGLLCCNCNRGIGYLGDSPQTLRAALDYLEPARV